MRDGFLGYRTSFMLDFVVVALILIVPALLYSIYTVKVQKQFARHRNLQVVLGVVLLVAVGAFEVDLQWIQQGWKNVVAKRANPLTAAQLEAVQTLLRIHLCFAITTPVLWVVTLVAALRSFPSPPLPGQHSGWHKLLGWLSTIDVTLTSITGLIFYYYAFVARY